MIAVLTKEVEGSLARRGEVSVIEETRYLFSGNENFKKTEQNKNKTKQTEIKWTSTRKRRK